MLCTSVCVVQFPLAPVTPELIMCSGQGNTGVLTVLSRGFRLSVATAVALPRCVASFTLKLPATAVSAASVLLFLVTSAGVTRVFHVHGTGAIVETVFGVGVDSSTRLEGFPAADFILDGITTGVGLVTFPHTDKCVLLQAHMYGVRVLDHERTLQDVVVHFDMDVGGLGSPGSVVRCVQAAARPCCVFCDRKGCVHVQ
jgi:hypothetical protein